MRYHPGVPPRSAPKPTSLSPDLRVVVLYGPETMLSRAALAELRASIEDKHGPVEPRYFDSKAALADVLDEVRSLSLLASYNLVIVDDADEWVKLHREALAKYVAAPADCGTLVLRASAWNKGNLDKAIEKVGTIIKCDRLNPRDAAAWLGERATGHHGVKLETAAAQRMVERIGSDLGLLDSELGKLAALVGGGAGGKGVVTLKAVEEVVGRSSDEKAWAMQDAVLETIEAGDAAPALRKLHEVTELAGEDDIVASIAVADLMRKLALAASMKRHGQSDSAIGKALMPWPFDRQRAFVAAAGRLGAKAPRWFDRAVAADRRAKSGLGNATSNLECLFVGLADDIGQRRGGSR